MRPHPCDAASAKNEAAEYGWCMKQVCRWACPLRLDATTVEIRRRKSALDWRTVPVSPDRRRVLVVEDDAPLAHLFCRALAWEGIVCARASDGVSALRSIEQQRPDLILLDLNLPHMSGFAIIRELAANPLTSDIPVIVVTGVEPKPTLPHALVVLCKPCDPDHVAKIVKDHLPSPSSSDARKFSQKLD
jgi:CheY-like chemotaxis protein